MGNYGKALYDTTAQLVTAADPTIQLMSVICTVFGGHISGAHAHSEAKTHRDIKSKAFNIYRRHLNMGLKISPSANQETHGKNPGTVTAARTGVWADALCLDGITEGMKANRVFATEDDELAVGLQVKHGGKTFWLGETVPVADCHGFSLRFLRPFLADDAFVDIGR